MCNQDNQNLAQNTPDQANLMQGSKAAVLQTNALWPWRQLEAMSFASSEYWFLEECYCYYPYNSVLREKMFVWYHTG